MKWRIDIKKQVTPLVRRRVRVGTFNIPIIFFLAAILAILPIGMAFGEESTEPAGRNLADPENPLVEITDLEFYTGTPLDVDKNPLPNLVYPDGTKIQNGNFWLSFNWRLIDPYGYVENGDYFDVVLDLGLAELAAEITQQTGTFAPVIMMSNGQAAGTIKWINQTEYQSQQRIVIRIELNDSGFGGLIGNGTEEGRVKGTGVWGFVYKAGGDAGNGGVIVWQIISPDGWPTGTIRIEPEQPGGSKPPGGGNEKYNPYDEYEKEYKKIGTRLTPENTSIADTIFYWNVFINGHKHTTIADWQSCGCGSLPVDEAGNLKETFTIIDEGKYISPTWLRDVTEADGKPVIHTGSPLMIDRSGGFYGQTAGETVGPAYFKLFYVNSAYIWNDRINYEGSNYGTPANDRDPNHRPSTDNPVGNYDPYFTTWYLREGEASSVLYAPNYGGAGGKYEGYLTPVPSSDIRSVTLKQNGYEIEMMSEAILGKTLAIAYMSKPATDENGVYHTDVGNKVSIIDVNDGNPVAGASGQVLIGGTISGMPPVSPNKGSFILEKYDLNTAQPMEGIAFDVIAESEDKTLEEEANKLIAKQKEDSKTPGILLTEPGGRLPVKLPPLPWTGGRTLTLKITETRPEGYVGVQPFSVTIEPENGTVISYECAPGDRRLIQLTPDKFGLYIWNKSEIKDTSFYDVALRKWIIKVDRVIDGEIYNIYYNNDPNTDVVSVKNGDVILYRIDVYNQCYNTVVIPGITDWLPPGLKFDPRATVAHYEEGQPAYNNSLWELVPGTDGAPDILNYIGGPITIGPRADAMSAYPEHRIPLILTVDVPEDMNESKVLSNIARITGLKNINGEDVEDIDSFIEKDRDSAGPVPGIEYSVVPPGVVRDNDIEGHRKNVDGEADLSEDEDTHDYASVIVHNPQLISCEVYKDTIRRTSAAYVSLPGHEGFNNVGSEEYRYDIDFRSTSSKPGDEFVVDDPLENVANGQVRIVGLWLPSVWGDEDGKMNVWYKSNDVKTDSEQIPEKALEITKKPADQQLFPTKPQDGWRLWATIDKSYTDRFIKDGVIDREYLGLPKGLAEGDYITAIRFEYGAVKVGFTSRNYERYSLNGDHRNEFGELTLSPADLAKVDSMPLRDAAAARLAGEQTAATPVVIAPAAEPEKENGNFFTRMFSKIFSKSKKQTEVPQSEKTALVTEVYGMGGPDDSITTFNTGQIVDWTPSPMDPWFSPGARNATGLLPASYLVKAIRPMENESIVSSAVSSIASQGLSDQSLDAVVTYQLTTFTLKDLVEPGYTIGGTFNDSIPRLEPNTEQGAGGRAVRTFDDMNLLFWAGMVILSLTSAMMILLLWYRRKKLRLLLTRILERRHGK
jgi:hypothetical protein